MIESLNPFLFLSLAIHHIHFQLQVTLSGPLQLFLLHLFDVLLYFFGVLVVALNAFSVEHLILIDGVVAPLTALLLDSHEHLFFVLGLLLDHVGVSFRV